MLNRLTLFLFCTLVATSCGLMDGTGGGSEAQVEILNQDGGSAGDSGDSQLEITSSADADSNTDAADGSDTDNAAGGTGTALEVLDGSVVIVEGDGRVSADPSDLQSAWGYLTIDDVYATDWFNERSPSQGAKFVALDYQFLIAEEGGSLYEEAYRLIADGETYPPLLAPDSYPHVGKVLNAALLFEVPENAQTFELRAGAPDDAVDGFLTSYSFVLQPGEREVPDPLSDSDVQLTTTNIELTSETDIMSTAPATPLGASGQLLLDSARTTTEIDGASAGADHKYLIVDYQMIGVEYGNFFGDAFRVQAADEWYSSITDVANIIDTGDVTNESLVFIVPRNTMEFVFEGGVPAQFEDGYRATYAISFDGASPSAEAGDVAVDDGDVEREASSISLASADSRMSTRPAAPAGTWGNLTVDSARTTAKVDADGAEPGWKFLVVDVQVVGESYGNLTSSAFRVVADGENYSPLNNFADIIDVDDVYSDTAIFLVPSSITEFTLVGGALESQPDGFIARYDIGF